MPGTAEAVAVGAVGALLGGLAGSLVGLAAPGAVVAAASGALAGRRAIYDWQAPKGVLAFVLDSTWALPTTAAGLFAHAAAGVRRDPQFAPELSRRRNRHVYGRGFQPRRGFAITLGNVVSGAGDVGNPRRAKLVTDHEDVHIWQARWLGPVYPLAYAGFAAVGAALGAVAASFGRGRLVTLVETCAYYLNPLEYWAYSRDGHWPPAGKLADIGPRRPLVRSFAERGQPRA